MKVKGVKLKSMMNCNNAPGSVTQEEHGHSGDEDQGHVDISALLTQHSG